MAEAAGLALGVIGVTALFSTCVEAFDIVVSARECSREYEELSALLGLQRLRFEIWGESVGLPSGRSTKEPKIPYNTQLDLPHVQPDIKRALENVRQLLSSVTVIGGRYGSSETSTAEEEPTTLSGTHIFQKSFDRLKKRIRKGQKEKSVLKVTRWALHDAAQFKETIIRLTAFVDGLYQVTTSLGLLQQRYEDLRVHEEINAITDGADLELLAEATSKHSGSSIHQTVSDAASKRLSIVAASVREFDIDAGTRSRPNSNASTFSFHTAKTEPSQRVLEAVEEEDSEEDDPGEKPPKRPSSEPDTKFASLLSARSCAECVEASLQCFVAEDATSCVNCLEDQKECSFDLGGSSILPGAGSTASLRSTPQHERLMAESVARAGPRGAPQMLSFAAGDAHHGDQMKDIDDNNLDYWIKHVAAFHSQAHMSSSVAKRMFYELKIIRKAKVPFISATPVADDLGKILASIEGPPETPYEGGVFWIMVLASPNRPGKAPILRFHTKIYHPNIDHTTGILCADFQQKWSPSKVSPSLKKHFAESTALWSERTSPDMWSLLSLLIAICGLMASPNINDPLVPEIAQKLVQDPNEFYKIAKNWTAKHAKASDIPDEASLHFPDEPSDSLETAFSTEPTSLDSGSELEYSSSAMQAYLRTKYDEKFDGDWVPSSSSSRKVAPYQPDSIMTTASGDTKKRRAEAIIDTLLLRDAEQSHLRQRTGERLSKIEQWRMIREVRLALGKESRRMAPGAWQIDSTSRFWSTDCRIRTLIRLSAIRLFSPTGPENLRKHLYTLALSFGGPELHKVLAAEHQDTSQAIPATHTAESKTNLATESDQAPTTTCSSERNVFPSAPSPMMTESSNHIEKDHSPSNSSVTVNAPELTSTASEVDYKSSGSDKALAVSSQSPRILPYPLPSYYPSSPSPPSSFYDPPASHGIYSSRTIPSPRKHSRHASQDGMSYSPTYIPRYASTGYYEESADTNKKRSSWTVRRPAAANHYNTYSYQGSYGDPDVDEYVVYNGTVYGLAPNREASTPARRSRQSASTPQRPSTAPRRASQEQTPPKPKATEADARRHRIPPSYSLKNWDPTEQPIMLLGSVFDANSLGKWIYDWTVYRHGPATPIADMAGELWLLLIQLAGKVKRAEDGMVKIRAEENRDMVEDFIDSGERLTNRLKKLLKSCETPMLKAKKQKDTQQLGKNAGTEFVDSIFGRDRQLESTEKLMASIRLWNLRFDANCEDILREPGKSRSSKSASPQLIMTPVVIRTTFGLEDIAEEPTTKVLTEAEIPAIHTESVNRAEVLSNESRSNRSPKEDRFTGQKEVLHSQKKTTNTASADGAVASTSWTSAEYEWGHRSFDWHKENKNEKKTEKPPAVEEQGSHSLPAQDDSDQVIGAPWTFKKDDQNSNGDGPRKESDAASKGEISISYGDWGFSTKNDTKMKTKIWDFGETLKEDGMAVEQEQGEDLDTFNWGSLSKKDKRKKKGKKKGKKKLDNAETLVKDDLTVKQEQDQDIDSSGWGSFTKAGKKKKGKKKLDVESTLPESDLGPILVSDLASKNEKILVGNLGPDGAPQ